MIRLLGLLGVAVVAVVYGGKAVASVTSVSLDEAARTVAEAVATDMPVTVAQAQADATTADPGLTGLATVTVQPTGNGSWLVEVCRSGRCASMIAGPVMPPS